MQDCSGEFPEKFENGDPERKNSHFNLGGYLRSQKNCSLNHSGSANYKMGNLNKPIAT